MNKPILAPVDFSAVSPLVIAEAAKLAALTRGQLVLLHVIKPSFLAPEYPGLVEDTTELIDAAERIAQKQLARWGRELAKAGTVSEQRLLIGMPGAEIALEAKRLRPEYIVMGSHGHGELYELMVGSTTRAVLKAARCPVVVVIAPPHRSPAARLKAVKRARRS